MFAYHAPDVKIGVLLSGGMDSALLLYLLAKNFPNDIQPITVPKHDGAAKYVNPILTWIENATHRSINDPIIIGNPDLHHSMIVGDALRRCFNHKLADVFYVGDNQYPEDVLPNGPKRIKMLGVYYPFFNWYKTDIVMKYASENIFDLLPLTHTCTERAVGRCNNCWQCKERIWAFAECNIQDLTTT